MSQSLPLENKVAIITGSSRLKGIGAAAAIALAKQGADVVIHYNSNGAQAADVVEKIKALGRQAIAVHADASAEDYGSKLVEAALTGLKTSHIDIVVNSTGNVAISGGAHDVAVTEWDRVFHVNVRGAFLVIQAALPHMPEGGRIINISSAAAAVAPKMLPVFSASKAALNALTRSLAADLGPKNITVNAIQPGPIDTDAMGALPEDKKPLMSGLQEVMFGRLLIKRPGTADEIAELVKYLASPNAGFTTGQIIAVDGGIA